MEQVKFNYDKENDDLFIYFPDKKSNGAVEIGNFVLDFDENENLVALQIIDASQVLSKLVSKILELTKIKDLNLNIVNFRNMITIKLNIITDSEQETANIIIPRIKQEESPALSY